MIPPALLQRLERAVHDALAGWPPAWTGFHWPGYTLQHTARVRRLALRFAVEEDADAEVVDLAALLHDIAKAAGKQHAEEGAEQARALLDGGLPPEQIERIAQTIAAHNRAVAGDPVEWRVLSDADKVDANYGLVAVARYFTIRGSRGDSLDSALADVPAWHQRHLEMLGWLTTATGRRCADERLATMHDFCCAAGKTGVARSVAQFFMDDSESPDLVRQVEALAAGLPGVGRAETEAIAERLRREIRAEL